MSQILRSKTLPFKARITRAHTPTARGGRSLSYPAFKDCLRWEFGFTCAICLLHEVHLVLPGTGAATSHQMTVEHIVLKSTPLGKPLENQYANCLLLCTYCNGARGNRHLHENPDGTRLLNPIADVWDDHFDLANDRLEPRAGDANAEYTRMAYAINDSVRTMRRQALRGLIDERIVNIRMHQASLDEIDVQLNGDVGSAEHLQRLLTARGRLCEALRREMTALLKFSGVPADKPGVCHCVVPAMTVAKAVSDGWQSPPIIRLPEPPLPSKRRFRA